jgi:hypothetical protein
MMSETILPQAQTRAHHQVNCINLTATIRMKWHWPRYLPSESFCFLFLLHKLSISRLQTTEFPTTRISRITCTHHTLEHVTSLLCHARTFHHISIHRNVYMVVSGLGGRPRQARKRRHQTTGGLRHDQAKTLLSSLHSVLLDDTKDYPK